MNRALDTSPKELYELHQRKWPFDFRVAQFGIIGPSTPMQKRWETNVDVQGSHLSDSGCYKWK